MRGKIKYTPPKITRLGTVERLTTRPKQTGPPDLLARHRLIG
jgi:hypothetical protein